MKKCMKCGAALQDDDVFCRSCGTNQESYSGPGAGGGSSTFLKYSSYIDDEALFKVAWAKEQGIVRSASPDEAEQLYQSLAIKNHLESMYRLAMVKLNKQPPEKDATAKWLKLAAEKGHASSINYLRTSMPDEYVIPTATGYAPFAPVVNHEPGGQMSGEDVFTKMQNAVVEIITHDKKTVGRASGFVASSTGFIITNAHAVLNNQHNICNKIQVKRGNEIVDASVVAVGRPTDGKHDSVDLALLFAAGLMDAGCAELGESSVCRNGQKVYLIGNSLGSGTCITSGIISDAHRNMPGLSYPYIMTDAAANHGNSGGPLLNEDGKVIGVLVSGVQNAEGMNYAIPIDVVKQFLSYIVNQTRLSGSEALREISSVTSAPVNMSAKSDKAFSGIHLLLDVIAFILSLF